MLSVSALAGYMYCPRKIYLQYVLKIAPPDKAVMAKGSIRHRTWEMVNLNERYAVEQIDKADQELITSTYRKRYLAFLKEAIRENEKRLAQFDLLPEKILEEMKPGFMLAAGMRGRKVFEFAEKNKLFGEKLWKRLVPKVAAEKWVECPELNLRGIIDAIEDYNDHLVPVELKTGKAPAEGVWPGHRIQAGAYILLLRENTEREVTKAMVRYLDEGKEVTIMMNAFLEKEIKELIKKVNDLMKADSAPPRLKCENKCRACGLKERCEGLELT